MLNKAGLNKAWGGRFEHAPDADAIKFNASLSFDHVLYQHDIAGSKAHAAMLAKQKLITTEEAESIIQGLDEIQYEMQQGLHKLDDACEDIHMFIEHLLVKKIGAPGKKLHTGRSRNDQVALDLRLYSRHSADLIKNKLQELMDTLQNLSDQHQHHKMPGYTHLQQAQPISLGTWFNAYYSMFKRDMSRLDGWYSRMNYSPLGAGALAGSALPLDRQMVAETLQFSGIIKNTLDAVSDRDFVIEFCHLASIIMMHLSRMSEDLILWATQEFAFVTLHDSFATGSSLMPNKKNPDVLELIRGKSGRVFGNLMSILTVMKGLPLAYNKDMQEDKECLFDSVNTLMACLKIITPFLNSLEFNTELMQEKANSGYLDATSVLESLVIKGVSFRMAHHKVGEWVKKAMKNQCSISDIQNMNMKKNLHLCTGKEVDSEDIKNILALAGEIKNAPEKFNKKLANKKMVMLFEKPSFRTRLSFALAMQELGGVAVESIESTRKHEHPSDMIRVLNGYADFVMMRTHDDNIFKKMSEHAEIPVINGLSALYHPCQILADLLSLQNQFGDLSRLTLAYIGDGNNILHSLMLMAPLLGVKIHYCCPANHQPKKEILLESEKLAKNMVKSFATPKQAVENVNAVYTDVWTSMGFDEKNDETFDGFQVNESLMSFAKPDAVFMHCMPMVRGKEVSWSLPDSPQSIIFSQSENRLHVQKALLVYLSRCW